MSSAFLKNTGGSFEFLLRAGGTAAAAAADVPKAFLNLWPTLGSLCLKRRPAPFSLVLRLLKLLLTLLRALVVAPWVLKLRRKWTRTMLPGGAVGNFWKKVK